MSVHTAAARPNPARHARVALLAGVSVAALFLGNPAAVARQFGSSSATIAPPTIAADAATEAAQQAAKVANQARDSMSRATQAIQAMQGAQAAARAAAQAAQKSATLPTAIPNGLGAGGLLPNVPAGWTGAARPTQSVDSTGQTNVNIDQNAAQAILNWTTFNVGARTTLTFDQHGNAAWVALNRVDASTGPSQILGGIKADGTVLVINQSGIIFGGGSQINVGSLIASSANITDAQLKTSGIYSTQVSNNYVPSFTGAGEGAAGGLGGKVIVEQGAQLTTNAPTSVTQGGGYVLLMGSEVDNAGSITTPKGQVTLAAGQDFILRPGLGTDANQYSTTRGNEIATGTWSGGDGTVGHWIAGGGTVTNTGIAFAQQGDITLAGHNITQDGVLLSTTSVNQRGTIHLLNSVSDGSGSVSLTGNSLALILPELDSGDSALNSQRDALIADSATQNAARAIANLGQFDNLSKLVDRADQSRIEIVTGGNVVFKGGSLTQAQGGQVAVSAVQRVMAESGATIDVSGVQGVLLPMSANEVQINVQGNELRDSPQNRDSGNLANKEVWIDVRDLVLVPAGTGGYATDRYYTPGGLLEVSGYLNNTAHGIGEWAAVGGSITLAAAEVVAQQGSTFNIAGGSVQYQGGYLQQTYVIGSGGSIYNINDAPFDITFKAVATGFVVDHPHWGVTEIYQSPWGNKAVRWEDGYTVGRDAGSLILSAPTSLFEGDIVADAIDGERQSRARPSGVTDGYKLSQDTVPLQGTLAVAGYTPMVNNVPSQVDGALTNDIVVGPGAGAAGALGVGDAVPSNLVGTTYLNASDLSSYRLGKLVLDAVQHVKIVAPLTLSPGGSLSILSPSTDIAADVTARGGSVLVTDVNSVGVSIGNDTSSIVLRSGVTIDTRGLWTNALVAPGAPAGLAYIDGGPVTLRSTGDVTLSEGARIDASAGAAILEDGTTKGGAGGDIALVAGYGASNSIATDHGLLTLDGEIAASGFTHGGRLTLGTSGIVAIGDDAFDLGKSLEAGKVLPIDVVLTQDVAWPAGATLPADIVISVPTSVPAGLLSENLTIKAGAVFENGTYVFYPSLTLTADLVLQSGAMSGLIGGYFYTAPNGVQAVYYGGADTIPAGSILPNPVTFVAGKVTVANGDLNLGNVATQFLAGDIAPVDATFHAGDRLRQNTLLAAAIQFQPVDTTHLSTSLFASGFSSYSIEGNVGLVVGAGTTIRPTAPVLRLTKASLGVATGDNPAPTFESYLAPDAYVEDPVAARLTQRPGADLILGSNSLQQSGWVFIGEGATIEVDPGHRVTLASSGTIDVEGTIRAPGGTIALLDTSVDPDAAALASNLALSVAGNPANRSFWIGASAVLDVSGRAYTALDGKGRTYGLALAGGSVVAGREGADTLGTRGIVTAADAFIVVASGAVIDASGVSVDIDLRPGQAGAATRPVTIASDGGTISLTSFDGIYVDGDLRAAAGGERAAGGTLNLLLETPYYGLDSSSTYLASVAAKVRVGRVLTVAQNEAPGAPLGGAPGLDMIAVGGGISASAIENGGFGTVSLGARDAIVFSGDVSLHAGHSITLNTAAIHDDAADGDVSVSAPYVFLDGAVGRDVPNGALAPTALPASLGTVTGASFTVGGDADVALIDVRNTLAIDFADTVLASQGDLRFLANSSPNGFGSISAFSTPSGALTLSAAQIYPASGARATITSSGQLSILSAGGAIPALPYSVFGAIAFNAPDIKQGGVIRAPLGSIALNATDTSDGTLALLKGSITSVSADGLVLPYGGTIDGVTYTVDGKTAIAPNLITGQYSLIGSTTPEITSGITLSGVNVIGEKGSRVDVSGGGELLGAAFVSGRGGSVDVLTTPLANANPANAYSNAANQVYALVPGATVAPAAGGSSIAWTGDTPQIGQQITIPDGVPGLPAGTYTLLPANYALLPGGYRVEIGAVTSDPLSGVVALGDGSYATSGYQGIANTTIRNALPNRVIVTLAAATRTYSEYNEQTYADFQRAQAATLSAVRPMLPEDGRFLTINLKSLPVGAVADGPALQFAGEANFAAAGDGYAGSLVIPSQYHSGAAGNLSALVIVGPDSKVERSAALTVIEADAINAFGVPNLYIGAAPALSSDGTSIVFSALGYTDSAQAAVVEFPVRLDDGAVLRAGQVVIAGGLITLGKGAGITTLGQGVSAPDTTATGYLYSNGTRGSLLAVSNGHLELTSALATYGAIAMGEGAFLYSDGGIGILSETGVSFAGQPKLGAREISLTVPSINIGSADALAAAEAEGTLPTGLNFDQGVLDNLLRGSVGAPALETLKLSATQSINLFGSVTLDTGDVESLNQLVLQSPAIYGAGGHDDRVSITTDTLVWNGFYGVTGVSNSGAAVYGTVAPGPTIVNGPGFGSGILDINAREIVLGYPDGGRSTHSVTLDRLALGFSEVNFNASESIIANDKGTLNVFLSGPSTSGYDAATYAGVGGTLNLITPLFAGASGAILDVRTDGALTIAAPTGAAAGALHDLALGADISLAGARVTLDTAIAAPSGRLSVTAADDVVLGDHARIDLAGRAIAFYDVTKYSWGGDLLLESTHGDIVQKTGSEIDLSADNAEAGTLTLTATDAAAGLVSLAGALRGQGDTGASIDIRAQRLGGDLSSDFAALNATLNDAGFTEHRGFDLKRGDLTIGNEVRAHEIAVSVDGGSLVVNGKIDASGERVGSIRLAARDDLTINGVLDAHGTVLRTDSDGVAIGASNTAKVELTSSDGVLTLASGSVIDLRAADNVARGELTLNAPRVGSTGASATGAGAPANARGDDVAIVAEGSLDIRGARSIAVQGFARYANAPYQAGSTDTQLITQDFLDLVDQDNTAFVDGALANAALRDRLSGLTVYGDAFHLRPGVELVSATADGNFVVPGDIDLAGYRYASLNPNSQKTAVYGSGEAMALVVRAGGDFTINGSITDGFAKPVSTVDDNGWQIPLPTTVTESGYTIPAGAVVTSVAIPTSTSLDFDLDLGTLRVVIKRPAVIPVPFYSTSAIAQTLAGGPWVTTAPIWANQAAYDAGAAPLYAAGATVSATVPALVVYGAGSVLPGSGAFAAFFLKPIPAGTVLSFINTATVSITPELASSGITLPIGTTISGYTSSRSVGPDGVMGQIFVATPALASGTLSSSMRLVAGADLTAADTRTLQAASLLDGKGDMLLSDMHVAAADGTPIASVIRTGAADLDIRAGGDFSQSSLFNISTNGWGDEDAADLTVEAQGTLTSYIWGGSGYVGNWLTGNHGTRAYNDGFTGFGALNGGNVTLKSGGDAGVLTAITGVANGNYSGTGLVVAAAGGGDVVVEIGGRLNPNATRALGTTYLTNEQNGVFSNLRGDIDIEAGAVGVIPIAYGVKEINDPRASDPDQAMVIRIEDLASPAGGITLVPGDGAASLKTRGDLILAAVGATATANYWTPTTSIELFSAGGNLTPITDARRYAGDAINQYFSRNQGFSTVPVAAMLTPIFSAIAADGSIYYGGRRASDFNNGSSVFRLAPSAEGQLELLAQDSIYGAAYYHSIYGAFQAARFEMDGGDLTLHEGDSDPIRVYALNGDLVNVVLGETYTYQEAGGGPLNTAYVAAKAVDVRAGGDIVNFGRAPTPSSSAVTPSLVLNANADDVSILQAGGNIYYANVQIAGLGTLEVSAGGNLYQGDKGSIRSIGALGTNVTSNATGGADIAVLAGVGANGPDYADFAKIYFNDANLADAAIPDTDSRNDGKVPATYGEELYEWLQARFGYAGTKADALAYFLALPSEQQGIFVRKVFYAELDAGGREYNDVSSKRYQSYLRGRDAITALFPSKDAAGNAITYAGDLTMFGGSGIQTQYGGSINVLTPGGQTVVGVQGPNPPSTAGLITQGTGDIDIYSLGSVLLGQSRIMTTFGGDIVVWSAEGDINAGRGAKTTVVYTPPRRIYDLYGRATLAPQVPSTGAGIATLNPIPEVPRGDINLIAPLGTIDAGEAGIRVSGNVNLAALQVLNAANIQVQGTSMGLPTVQGPPVAALTSATNTAAATQQSVAPAPSNTGQASVMIVEIIGYGGGDGGEDQPDSQQRRNRERQSSNGYDPSNGFRAVGNGTLTEEQRSKLTERERANLDRLVVQTDGR